MTFSHASAPEALGKAMPRYGKEDALFLLALAALCLVLFFFRLGAQPLWDVDEGMHAATSKDMVLTGDWITPKSNGQNFYDKTAFFNWLVALSMSMLGFTELAARLPAAVLGLATVLMTYAIGRRMGSSRLGLLAGAILATSPEFIVLSRSVVHDISLALFVTAALFFFFQAYTNEHRRRMNLMLFYASAGVAVLAKGPIGVLLPGMIIFLFLLLRGRLAFLKDMSMGWGTLVFLAVAAPWYVLISMRNSDYASYFFLKQNFGQFLSKAKSNHPRPFYYYVPALLGGMMPWSFFLPVALYRPLAKGLKRIDDGALFLICWSGAIFLFFSTAESKMATYLLPAFPAFSLLVAAVWSDMMESAEAGLRKAVSWSLAPLVTIFVVTTGYLNVSRYTPENLRMIYGINLHEFDGLSGVMTVILFLAVLFFSTRKYRAAFSALAATFVVGFLIALTVYIPRINPYRSTVTLAQEMDSMLPPGQPLVFFWKLKDSSLFYTNRRAIVLNTEGQLLDYLASNKPALCVIEEKQYEKFPLIAERSRVVGQEGNKLLIEGSHTEMTLRSAPRNDRKEIK